MTYKILIVDDETMITELLNDHLRDCGYDTMTAGSGEEAIDLLQKKPDLILLDINMPGMDGLELCKTIRSHVSCPILFLTARITEQDKINGLQYGGDDYITKPFSLNELTARIAAHLRRDERTKEGRKNILLRNGGICLCTSVVFSLVPFLCRAVGISQTYPLHGWGFSVNNIPYCSDFPLPVPVVFYIFLLVLAQAASVMIITLVVLVISAWRKNHIQTVFFAILVLAVPLTLKLLGFSFAGWFSVYPLYSWTTG